MYSDATREKFLEILEEIPFIKYACRKMNVDRTTIYRWMKEDRYFNLKVNNTLTKGRQGLVEDAEYGLLKKIRKDEDQRAIEFYLRHNDKRYYPRRAMDVFPLEADQYQLSLEEHMALNAIVERIMGKKWDREDDNLE